MELSVAKVTPRFRKRTCLEFLEFTNGWILNIEVATRNDFSIAWIPTVSFYTYVPSQVTLGGTMVDPALLNNVEIPLGWTEYLYHVGCSTTTHSILQSVFITGGRDAKEGRQCVTFICCTVCKSPTLDILRKSSRTFGRS